MSDPTTVDRTTVDELTGKLVLLIEESRAWRETDLMHRQLAAKVKTYVRYARSQKFNEEHGRPAQGTIVRIVSAHPPGEASLQFFQRVAHELGKHGLQFEHQLGDDGFPETVTPRLDATSPPQTPRAPSAARPTPAPPTPTPPTPTPTAGPPPVPPPRAPAPPQPRPPTAPPAAPPPPARPQPQRPAADVPPLPEVPQSPPPRPRPQQPAADVPPLPEVPPAPAPPPPDPWAEDAPAEPAVSPPLDPWAEEAPAEPSMSPPPAAEFIEPTQAEELEFEPTFPGALGDLEYEPSAAGEPGGLEFEPAFPGGQDDTDAGAEPSASDLERLIEGDDEVIEFIGGAAELEPAAARPPPERRPGEEASYPPFFPEEEFGRALPGVDEIASMGMDAEATTAVIETASGKQIRLDRASSLEEIAAAVPAEQGPSLLRAVGAAILGAFAGAIVWVLLAIPAATGASPLALAVAVMVGFNVRLRGAGHTMPFRVVGVLGTFLGSALGSIGAAVALSAMEAGTQIAGVLEILSNTDAVLDAFTSRYSLLDLLSLVLASYIAFRISASKPS